MKIFSFIFYILLLICSPLYAQKEPIRIAVDSFDPPFVIAGANKQLSGFDVAMMEHICRTLDRQCTFIPMHFDLIFNSLITGKADVGVSGITITAERAAQVHFSSAYLLSHVRFIGPLAITERPFSLETLHNCTIGVRKTAAFSDLFNTMGVKNAKLIAYNDIPSMIDALNKGKLDLALLDAPSAIYWQAQSSGKLSVWGEPLLFGYGFGIAVDPNKPELLQDINRALAIYHESEEFKSDYNKYISNFQPFN